MLPTRGECVTLGTPTSRLGSGELSRIGVVDQHAGFVDWMSAGQVVRYVSSFYRSWDLALELAGSPRDTALGVVALAIVVQTVHWFALRSYFTTRDLVRRSI